MQAMARKRRDHLYLVLDTNFFLQYQNNRNSRHDGDAKDPRTPVELLLSFQAGRFGALPPVIVRIPYIVRLELSGIGTGPERGWIDDKTAPAKARVALDFMDEVQESDRVITFQSRFEHDAMNLLRNHENDSDEMVLLSCLQTREEYSKNVCLVTNDVQLSARSFLSDIRSITFHQLKYAIRLRNGPDCAPGESYLDGTTFGRKTISLRRMVTLDRIEPEVEAADDKSDFKTNETYEDDSAGSRKSFLDHCKAIYSAMAGLLQVAYQNAFP